MGARGLHERLDLGGAGSGLRAEGISPADAQSLEMGILFGSSPGVLVIPQATLDQSKNNAKRTGTVLVRYSHMTIRSLWRYTFRGAR